MGCSHTVCLPLASIRTCSSTIYSLISHASIRFATLDQLKGHPFFKRVPWDNLRDQEAPFVPQLESEEDTLYYDDFTDEADMAKYQEVIEKHCQPQGIRCRSKSFSGCQSCR